MSALVEGLVHYVRFALPEGRQLPTDVWRHRHNAILGLLWLHALGVSGFGLIAGFGLAHSLAYGGILGFAALVAGWGRLDGRLRSAAASLGLLAASAILVHLSGGYIEMHFHFFVMIVVIALYQDWVPFLCGIGFVLVHHGVVGVLMPTAVYNHPDAWAHPWKWAAIHAVFVAGSSIASLVNWRLSEAARARTELLLRSIGEGIFGVDLQERITFANPAAASMLGWQEQDLVGRPVRMLLHPTHVEAGHGAPDDAGCVTPRQDGAIEQLMDAAFRCKDGSSIPVEYLRTPIHERGQLVGAVVTFKDISERKRLEELRASEEQFRRLFEHSPDGILLIDPYHPDGTWPIVDCNDVAGQMNGYTREELVGQSIDLLQTEPWDRAARLAYLERLRDEGRIYLEAVHRRKDGTHLPVAVSSSLITLAGRELVLAIDRDITERKRIDRMQNEFISTVSHELRTPLTSIRGSLGLLSGGVAGTLAPQAKAMIDIAYKNSERLVRLINDILDSEKIESGKVIFDLKPVELMPLIEQALESNRGYGQELGVSFELSAAVPGATVYADGDRLMQVLANLLSNAAKFSPDKGTVHVAVTRHGTDLRVAVRDQGPGIPREFRQRIFQKFAQADSSDTRQKGGTGLGLSITKAIVERLGGQIGFTTEEGAGTTFYFDLPEYGEESAAAAATVELPYQPRILICEDDRDIAMLLSMMLQQSGAVTTIAYDAAQAKQLLAEHTYDGMTLDLALPDQNGIALIRELRGVERTRSLPIVVVSAQADQGRAELNGDAIGIVDWLKKPIDPARLIGAIRQGVPHRSTGLPRILHVEDNRDIVRVVAALLQRTAAVVSATSLQAATELLAQQQFDLIILDIGLPDGSGLDLLPVLNRQAGPPCPVIVFSAQEVTRETVREVSAALVKSRTTNEKLLETIKALVHGDDAPRAAPVLAGMEA